MSDIFISYASEDRGRAETIATALAIEGWSVWWDRKIPAGKRFRDVIQDEISTARCVVVLWSAISVRKDWVVEEAQDAKDREILVPVFLEHVQPPRGFRLLQAKDLTEWAGDPTDSTFRALCEDIAGQLGQSATRAAAVGEPPVGVGEDSMNLVAPIQLRPVPGGGRKPLRLSDLETGPATIQLSSYGRHSWWAVPLVLCGIVGLFSWKSITLAPTADLSGPSKAPESSSARNRITRIELRMEPSRISLGDSSNLVVSLLDESGKPVANDVERSIAFSTPQDSGKLSRSEVLLRPGDAIGRVTFTPLRCGRMSVAASSSNLLSVTALLSVDLPLRLLVVSTIGGLIGGAVLRMYSRTTRLSRVAVGVLGGVILFMAFLVVSTRLRTTIMSPTTVLAISIFGGWLGTYYARAVDVEIEGCGR